MSKAKNLINISDQSFSVKCPNCHKRAFDIKMTLADKIEIQLKCPHCKKLVTIPVVK